MAGWHWRFVRSPHVPSLADSEISSFPACAQNATDDHAQDNGQRSDILRSSCLVYFHIQASLVICAEFIRRRKELLTIFD